MNNGVVDGLASGAVAFTAAVLAGGGSTRMGRDKALLCVDGVALASRVARACREAGASEVIAVGGDTEGLAALGLRTVSDVVEGEGPLAGVLAALGAARDPLVVISACDTPWLGPLQVRSIVDGIGSAAVGVGAAAGHLQPLLAVWRRSALPVVQAAFDDGERSPRRLIATMSHVVIELGDGEWAFDVDTPEDAERATGSSSVSRGDGDSARRPSDGSTEAKSATDC